VIDTVRSGHVHRIRDVDNGSVLPAHCSHGSLPFHMAPFHGIILLLIIIALLWIR